MTEYTAEWTYFVFDTVAALNWNFSRAAGQALSPF